MSAFQGCSAFQGYKVSRTRNTSWSEVNPSDIDVEVLLGTKADRILTSAPGRAFLNRPQTDDTQDAASHRQVREESRKDGP